MSWCPDTAKIKKKMLYSSSFDALKSACEGIGKYIQVSFLNFRPWVIGSLNYYICYNALLKVIYIYG